MYSTIIVDDEELIRTSIARFIQNTQPEFQIKGIFSCCADAVTYLKDNPVHVIISDIRMPGVDGLSFAQYVHKKFPQTVFVLITAYGEFEYAQKALQANVFNYLLKPLDFAELTNTLERIKQSLHVESTFSDTENTIQSFFFDIICGSIRNDQVLDDCLQNLSTGNLRKDYAGCFLTLFPNQDDPSFRQYPSEKQALRMLQSIRCALPEYHCYYLFHVGKKYLFVILSPEHIPQISIPCLTQRVLSDTHLSCLIHISSDFSSIHELFASIHSKQSPPSELQLSEDLDTIITQAINFIATHYANDISREDVANAVFLSPAYFSRLFKQKTGMSFIDYVTKIRMEKAIELLGTHKKIGEIANEVGYLSRNRFSTNFKQFTGCTPSEYRRTILMLEDTNE